MFASTRRFGAFKSAIVAAALLAAGSAQATFLGAVSCSGANACSEAGPTSPYPIPNPVTQDPNNGVLLVWNERQNVTLTSDLRVDRVADASASYVGSDAGGLFIKAGTIVSSHYLQWDPGFDDVTGLSSVNTVQARLQFDSDIFAFITADQKLFDSDAALGLAGLNYNDFGLRGLEGGDTTEYPFEPSDYSFVDVRWSATTPGDWTRLITAFSPAAAVPLPSALLLLLAGLPLLRRR